MKLEWDGKVGPAAVIGMFGSLSVLVAIGISWGSTTTRVDLAAATAAEVKLELAKSGNTLTAFQSSIIKEVQNISSDVKVTVRALTAHEESDRQLRTSDTDAIKSFERRLLTIERSAPARNGSLLPAPSPN